MSELDHRAEPIAVEHDSSGALPVFGALAFANLLSLNGTERQVGDVTTIFERCADLGHSAVMLFACELRRDTAGVLTNEGWQVNMYVQDPITGVGQGVIVPHHREMPEVTHQQLSPNSWVGRRSGPAAVSFCNISFGGEDMMIAGSHLTHLTGNVLAQAFEARHLSRSLKAMGVRLGLADLNRGMILKDGQPLDSSALDVYFSEQLARIRLLRQLATWIQGPYVRHLTKALDREGYSLHPTTKNVQTWSPVATNKEGFLDEIAAYHGVGSATDQVIIRTDGNFDVTVCASDEFFSDHTPFIVTAST